VELAAELRNKWLSIGLLVLILFAYELFDLWSSPWWTAWLIVGYFAAALLVDGAFKHASFCKFVCPIGQFNFVASLVSPLEVKVRDEGVCSELRNARLHPRPARGYCEAGCHSAGSGSARCANWRSFSHSRRGTWTALSASIVCRRARTTTSEYWGGSRRVN
jgi:polyferredoxin